MGWIYIYPSYDTFLACIPKVYKMYIYIRNMDMCISVIFNLGLQNMGTYNLGMYTFKHA
jgi:hypothetical protein